VCPSREVKFIEQPPVFPSVGVMWNHASAMLLNPNVRKYRLSLLDLHWTLVFRFC
jgi:hypothetical protein